MRLFGICSMLLAVILSTLGSSVATQAPEKLDRGLVAIPTAEGKIYLGWRLLMKDSPNIAFNIYRSTAGAKAVRLNQQPIAGATNFVDSTALLDRANTWWVKPVMNGREGQASVQTELPANPPKGQYLSLKFQGDYAANKLGIGDLDGDGELDFVIKQPGASIDPGQGYWRRSSDTYKLEAYRHNGTFMWRKDLGWNIEMGIWYSPMVVFDLDGDGKAEVAVKTAPTDVDYRNAEGHVMTGPEYVSILDGMTGQEIAREDWIARGKVSDWGDSFNNRASRHAIGVAYLDGQMPHLILHRGTYTTMRVDAYVIIGKRLKKVWSWNGDQENPPVRGQGMHGMKVVDLDDDGRDEIVIGAAALDDNGKLLWNTNLGHPDVVYVADIDPARPGLEIAYGIEPRRSENGICLVDARTGRIIWGLTQPTTHIHDQGMVADLNPNVPGMEIYGAEADGSKFYLHSAKGELLAAENMGGNSPHALYWDDGPIKVYIPGISRFRRPRGAATADAQNSGLLRPVESRPAVERAVSRIVKYKGLQIGEIEGRIVGLADIVGDWREEVITCVPGELRIYTTTILATTRRVTLMQDRLYRYDVAVESMGYFFPPQLSGKLFDALPKGVVR
jgi:rhamnogalacturonan endolyase